MQILSLILTTLIAALVFATGLQATPGNVAWSWRHPALLVRSLLAMYVVVPVIAFLMVRVLPLPPGTEIAIVVLAICAGAPLLPRKLLKFGGDPHYVISLVVTTSLLAILAVPAWLLVLRDWLSLETPAAPGDVARVLGRTFLLPVGAGIVVRAILPGIAAKVSDLILKLAGIGLAGCGIVLMVALRHEILAIGLASFIAFAAFALVGIVAGHVLGGPDPTHRTFDWRQLFLPLGDNYFSRPASAIVTSPRRSAEPGFAPGGRPLCDKLGYP
jgi:BASS family bile acid:Na+ symporter